MLDMVVSWSDLDYKEECKKLGVTLTRDMQTKFDNVEVFLKTALYPSVLNKDQQSVEFQTALMQKVLRFHIKNLKSVSKSQMVTLTGRVQMEENAKTQLQNIERKVQQALQNKEIEELDSKGILANIAQLIQDVKAQKYDGKLNIGGEFAHRDIGNLNMQVDTVIMMRYNQKKAARELQKQKIEVSH